MNRHILHLVVIAWMSLMVSCEKTGTDISKDPDADRIPDKTTTGSDILVLMVNANMQLEVYNEQSEHLFSSDDILADRVYTSNIPLLKLSARQRPKDDPSRETHISFAMRLEDPQVNVIYHPYATYNGPRGNFIADNTSSLLRFSRIDSQVAAGEFSFLGTNPQNDTMRFTGYFDIPFTVK